MGSAVWLHASGVTCALIMVLYELNCLLSCRAPIDATVSLIRGVARGVVRGGGVVHRVNNHGIRPLGQPIRKAQEAHQNAQYVALDVDIGPKVLKQLEHNLRVSPHVLRFMPLKSEQRVSKMCKAISESRRRNAQMQQLREGNSAAPDSA